MWTSILLILLVVVSTVIYFAWKARKGINVLQSSASQKSVLIVVGSGGHTREILSFVKAMDERYQPRFYIIAETDTMSKNKILDCEKEMNIEYQIIPIPRSREVKQSYLTSVLTTLRAVIHCFPLVFKLKPDVILCNGPGTCIPICAIGLFLRGLHLHRTIVVYVESICRVKSLSLSGKLLYHFADSFVVQWPELTKIYPKAKYFGRLV